MQDLKQKIEEIVHHNLQSEDYYLVDIIIPGGKNAKKILVLIDGDEGVSISVCSKLSRAIAAALDELDLLEQAYTLEVSSPGLEYPLQLKRQYKKNVGRNVKVVLQDDSIITGKLSATSEETITIIKEDETPKKGKKKKSSKGTNATSENLPNKDLDQTRDISDDNREIIVPFSDIKKTNVLVSFT